MLRTKITPRSNPSRASRAFSIAEQQSKARLVEAFGPQWQNLAARVSAAKLEQAILTHEHKEIMKKETVSKSTTAQVVESDQKAKAKLIEAFGHHWSSLARSVSAEQLEQAILKHELRKINQRRNGQTALNKHEQEMLALGVDPKRVSSKSNRTDREATAKRILQKDALKGTIGPSQLANELGISGRAQLITLLLKKNLLPHVPTTLNIGYRFNREDALRAIKTPQAKQAILDFYAGKPGQKAVREILSNPPFV